MHHAAARMLVQVTGVMHGVKDVGFVFVCLTLCVCVRMRVRECVRVCVHVIHASGF